MNLEYLSHLHNGLREHIAHFLEQYYKALEFGKRVKVESRVGMEEARQEIMSSIEQYNCIEKRRFTFLLNYACGSLRSI